jgi:predicted Zn-dependent peptidase
VEDAELTGGPQLLLVDWPEAPQSTIRVAGRAVTRADSRWPALFVANHAVGGSFSARINTVLREEKGYTYGATSTLDSTRCTGVFSVSTAVDGAATAEAVGDILSIVAAAQGTITDAEVATAVRAVTQSAPLGYERAEAVAGRAELLISQRLPLDHVDANLERIRAVTTGSANAAYLELVDPHSLTVLVVGDASSAGPGLSALGYSPLRDLSLPWR